MYLWLSFKAGLGFETLTLIQTGKLKLFPIILMGKDYWKPLMAFVHRMVEEGTISPDDPDLIFYTDNIDEAVAHLQHHAVRQFALRRKRVPKAISFFGEKTLGH